MKTLIKNATIVDGTGAPRRQGNILLDNNRIEAVGCAECAADEIIDATGLVASPGFIDTHSHSDLQILINPEILPKVMQGVTTEVLGQDGVAMAPLPQQYISPWRKNLAGLDGDSDDIDWNFKDTAGYLKLIEAAKPGLNECYLVP
ncbi:MAG: amidohydrolase family protein, partial [Angelakisella sp.]